MFARALIVILCLIVAGAVLSGGAARAEEAATAARWRFGFGRRPIVPPEDSGQPLYIAGYRNGVEITDVLDLCEARAVWLDAGGQGVLMIGLDCVAVDSGTVGQIRDGLSGLTDCAAVMVYSTHTHAGPDTLGLWGPVGRNGKNSAYMKALIDAAVEAGREAASAPREGTLAYGVIRAKHLQRDSRDPQCCDDNLYQLRLTPDGGGAGVRMLFYGAHAESLRGDNTLLSRDFPGRLCDLVKEETGDDAIFLPGAVGGLIMTREFVGNMPQGAVDNMNITAGKLLKFVREMEDGAWRALSPQLRLSGQTFTVPLDNTVFLLYKTLGILNSRAVPARSATGFGVSTELDVVALDDVVLALLPGEIFPELVLGGPFGDANPSGENPRALRDIAADHGVTDLLIVGLANDELGYIVPPSDFLVNEKAPYVERTKDARGEDHYEETNSVGPACAGCIADAFDAALGGLGTDGL